MRQKFALIREIRGQIKIRIRRRCPENEMRPRPNIRSICACEPGGAIYHGCAMKHQLDFEKPIIELQRKLDELEKTPGKPCHGHQLRGGNRGDESKDRGNAPPDLRQPGGLGPGQNRPPSQAPVHARLRGAGLLRFLRNARGPPVCGRSRHCGRIRPAGRPQGRW